MTEPPWILELRRRLRREWVVPDVVKEIAEGTPDARPAAVLVPLYVRERELWTLFTKRSEAVETHKGQIAFPGGMEAVDDASPWETALRETEEEIGYAPGHLTRLGAIYTTPGFTDEVIHLFAAHDLAPSETRHEADEVMSVERLKLAAAVARIESGEIRDAKTICALLIAARLWGEGPPAAQRSAPA